MACVVHNTEIPKWLGGGDYPSSAGPHMETLGCVCCLPGQAFCPLPLASPNTGSRIPGQGHCPQPHGPHATSGNHWKTQMALGLAAKSIWWQKAGPSQEPRPQSSASDHGHQWTQQNPAPQTRRCLATREDGASNEGSGRHTSFQKARFSGSCPSCSGISLEPCLWGQPRAEGRPELDVSMVQPR